MNRVFCNNLRKELYKYVKGSVSVHIIKDTLIVDIQALNMKQWRISYKNIEVSIVQGLSSKNLAIEIVKQYKGFILDYNFFK